MSGPEIEPADHPLGEPSGLDKDAQAASEMLDQNPKQARELWEKYGGKPPAEWGKQNRPDSPEQEQTH